MSDVTGLALAVTLLLLVATSASAADEAPLTVHYEVALGDDADSSERETLRRALGIVSEFLEETFAVARPETSGALYLEPTCVRFVTWSGSVNREECLDYSMTTCGRAAVNPDLYRPREVCDQTKPNNCRTEGEGSPGAPGAQLVVYVTSEEGGDCSSGQSVGELASATYCTRSPKDSRPTSGAINICPDTLRRATTSEKEFQHFVDTMAHEHVHILGFNPGLFPDFVDGEGGEKERICV